MKKLEYPIKILLITFFIFYAYVQTTLPFNKINDPLFGASLDKIQAIKLHGPFEIAILGGSNAFMGLSSRQITQTTHLSSYNFSVYASEGANIIDYADWLKENQNTAKIVIYSSMNLWYLGKDAPFEAQRKNTIIITTPLIRAIYNLLKNPEIKINEYGDLSTTSCDSEISPFTDSFTSVPNIEKNRILKFIETASKLKNALSADELFVRAPPVYVAQQSIEKFNTYLSHIAKALKEK